MFSISTNQAMVFEGGRRAGWLPFCIASGQERSLVRGEEVSSHSLHGFRSDLQDSFFQLQNGSQLQVALVSRTRLEQLALRSQEQRRTDPGGLSSTGYP